MRAIVLGITAVLTLSAPARAFDVATDQLADVFNKIALTHEEVVRIHLADCLTRVQIVHCSYSDGKTGVIRVDSSDGGKTISRISLYASMARIEQDGWAPIIAVLSEIAAPTVPIRERLTQIEDIAPGNHAGKFPYQSNTLVGRAIFSFDLAPRDVLTFSVEDLDAPQ